MNGWQTDKLYVMNADGSQKEKILDGLDHDWASFSPDKRKIAYCKETEGLRVVDIDGSNEIVLTTDWYDRGQIWSPDGNRIAFIRGAEAYVYLINADGSNLRQVTNSEGKYQCILWQRDGKSLFFVGNTNIHWGTLYSMDINSTSKKKIVGNVSESTCPSIYYGPPR